MSQTVALRATITATENLTPLLRKINAATAVTRKSIMDIGRATTGLSMSIAKPFAVVGGAAGIAGIVGGTKGIMGVTGQFEDFGMSLKTLTGSSEQAKKSMEWIRKFAVETPYKLADVTSAFIDLKTFGLDPTKGILKAAGDIAALKHLPINMAVEALSSAMRGQTDMLDNFAVQAKIVGEKMIMWYHDKNNKTIGFNWVNKNNPEQIARAAQYIWNQKAGGLMEEQAKGWNGMLSTLSDSWDDFLLRIGQAGIFEFIKSKLKGLLEWFSKMDANGSLQKWATKISTLLEGVGTRFERWINDFDPDKFLQGVDRLANSFGNLARIVGGVDNLMIGTIALFSAEAMASIIAIAGAFGTLAVAIGKTAMALAGLVLANPIIALISAAIIGLGAVGYEVYINWESIKKGLIKTWDDTLQSVKFITAAISKAWSSIWDLPRQAYNEFFAGLDRTIESARGIAERVHMWINPNYRPPELPGNIAEIANQYATRYKIPPELLRRVIQVESGGNPFAVSPKGAIGLMQLMPETIKTYGVKNPFDPTENIAGGTKYLSYLIDRFGGDQAKALAAYNAGESNVDKYGGVPPFHETRAYVDKILGASRHTIIGDIGVRFENAPTGMRIESPRTDGPLTVTPSVGYRSFATDVPR